MAESSHRKYLKRVTVVSTFGGLLFGYDTGVINGALAFMARPDQLNLTPAVEGFVASGLLFGAAIGSFFGGRLSDAEGRRKMLLCLAVIFFFAAIGCSLSPTARHPHRLPLRPRPGSRWCFGHGTCLPGRDGTGRQARPHGHPE